MLEIIGIILIIIGLLMLGFSIILSEFNNNFPSKKRKSLDNFCILIPARYESEVIEELLISINNQTKKINMSNVYIIVESEDDPTNIIAFKYGASIFVRKKLDLKSKGYALDEVIVDLCNKNIYYDAYFIFDADNVLDKNFIKKMEVTYKNGYDIGIGFRNFKNGNDSIISACSGITFSFLNSNGNDIKSKQSRNITLSGTGFFINGELIKKWKSFPFHSLTEDYELTLYSILYNLKSFYNKEAMFYDEQPVKYKDTINQRIRWIKGYFTNRKIYLPLFKQHLKNNPNIGSIISETLGMRPYIVMIVGAILYILNQIINMFLNSNIIKYSLIKIGLIIILAYILFSLMTLFVIAKDGKRLNLSLKMRIKAILFSPFFFVTYIPCALKALFIKDVKWETVKHNRKLNIK